MRQLDEDIEMHECLYGVGESIALFKLGEDLTEATIKKMGKRRLAKVVPYVGVTIFIMELGAGVGCIF